MPSQPQPYSTIVIGAGAAGLMAAGFAASTGKSVLLLERTADGGKKIVISGGGRCNVLPSRLSPSDYITSTSPSAMKKILRAWPLADQRRFFEEELGLPLRLEEETGKLFPETNRARDVRDGLVEWGRRRGAQFRFNQVVRDVRPSGDGAWRVIMEGEELSASRVILATGGLSVPATGSDGIGLAIARRLGHTIAPTYPALTPLTCDEPTHHALAGVSLPLQLESPGPDGRFRTEGGFLFTHRGYSGPAVLDISHVAVLSRINGGERREIYARWIDRGEDAWRKALLDGGNRRVLALLVDELPSRLAEMLVAEIGIEHERRCADLRREEREKLVAKLTRYRLPWSGDEGYKKAEVTGGGVSLDEIDVRTMESLLHPGLHLCGEILDAFGPIGGYNFLWAWGTGRRAGEGSRE